MRSSSTQVEAKALGFVVFPLPTPSPSPALLAPRTSPFGGLGTTGHVGRINGQNHDRPPLAPGGGLRNAILDVGRLRTHLQHLQRPGLLQHLVNHTVTHRRVGGLVQQVRGALVGHLQGQLDPGLLHVPLLALPRQAQGLVQRIEPVLTGNAVEIGTLQGHRPEKRFYRARTRRARSHQAFALGAGRLFLGQERSVAAFDKGFHQRRGDLHQRRRRRSGLAHLRLHSVQPFVQGFMRLASKAVPELSLLKGRQRENRTHRSPSSLMQGSAPRGRRQKNRASQ